VGAPVVGALQPGTQEAVELGQGEVLLALRLDEELLAQSAKEALDLAAPLRAPGLEWIRRMPSTAQARASWAEANGEPLST
jgi:hypothetical protein